MIKYAHILICIVSCLFLSSCSPTTTIYIVRHGEKAGPTGDVPLSSAGLERANALAERLKSNKPDAVYSTNTKRTLQTAQPAAAMVNVQPQVYSNGDSLVKQLLQHPKKTYLVVGHSNTVPQMIRSIPLPVSFNGNIPDSVYSYLFVIKKKMNKAAVVEELRY